MITIVNMTGHHLKHYEVKTMNLLMELSRLGVFPNARATSFLNYRHCRLT